MQLRVQVQHVMLGLQFRLPHSQIDIKPHKFELKQKQGRLELEIKQPQVKIDQTKCFEDEGMRTIPSLMRYWSAQAYNKVVDTIGEIARDGNKLGAIETGYTIADWARDHSFNIQEFNIGMVPRHAPEITVETHEVKVRLIRGYIRSHLEPGQVKVKAPWEKVKIFYLVPPEVKVSVDQVA